MREQRTVCQVLLAASASPPFIGVDVFRRPASPFPSRELQRGSVDVIKWRRVRRSHGDSLHEVSLLGDAVLNRQSGLSGVDWPRCRSGA